MEVSIAALLLGAGYVMSRATKAKTRAAASAGATHETQPPPPATAMPSQRDVYESTYYQDAVRRDEILRAGRMASAAAQSGVDTGIVSPHAGRLGLAGHQRSPRGYGDGWQRAQHAGGPGSAPARTIVSPLTGREITVEDFTTQGMVPFYGGSVKQPSLDQSESAYGNKLEVHTGAFSLKPWGEKQATQPLFQPSSQGPMSSAGRPIQTGDRIALERATIVPSTYRANERPPELEPELVGRPGILGRYSDNIQYDAVEAAMERGLAPTVDQLRSLSNPKETYEGRMLAGAGIQSPIGTHFAIPEATAERFGGPLIREVRNEHDMIRTTGAVTAERPRPADYRDIRGTHRQSTTSSYYGVAGSKSTAVGQEQRPDGLSREAMPLLPTPPLGVATIYKSSVKDDFGRSSIAIYGNNRSVTTTRAPVANLSTVVKALTMRSAEDTAKTTRKQLLAENEAPIGNMRPNAHRPMTYYDPQTGIARTSLKETMLSEAPLMGPDAMTGRGSIVYDPEDWRPAPTLKQLITDRGSGHTDGHIGGPLNAVAGVINNFEAPTTQRQVSEATRGTAYGGPGVGVDGGYAISQGMTVAEPTNRQTTSDHDRYGQARGGQTAPLSYDAAKAMRHDEGRETTLFGRAPTAQGSKQFPDSEKTGCSTLDPRHLAPDATESIPAAPINTAVPTTLSDVDRGMAVGLGARAPPHDDERLDSAQSDARFVDAIAGSAAQRQNNPYVIPGFAEDATQ